METHRQLISLWPSIAAFADDIGVPENTAKQMRTRNSVNGIYWALAAKGAEARGIVGAGLDAWALSVLPAKALAIATHQEAGQGG